MEDELFDVLLGCVDALLKDMKQLLYDNRHRVITLRWWYKKQRLNGTINLVHHSLQNYKIDKRHYSLHNMVYAVLNGYGTIDNMKLWRRVGGRKHAPPRHLIELYHKSGKEFLLSIKDLFDKLDKQ